MSVQCDYRLQKVANEGDFKMEFNKKIIIKYADQYKKLYKEQHGENPTSWFSYFRWLGSFTNAGNFNDECVELGKKVLA